MECNWLAVVRGDGGARACVFCGQHRREHSKSIGVAGVGRMIDSQKPALQDERFARTLRNICAGALDSHARWGADEREAQFSACLCCHHWVARRRKTALVFPLQALSWYVNTMQTLHGKNMDHRVVMRLCQVLTERGPLPAAVPDAARTAERALARAQARVETQAQAQTKTQAQAQTKTQAQAQTKTQTLGETRAPNTYAALFNDSEQALFARIAADSIDAVGTHLARFYHSQNARTIFSPSCALVEKLRRYRARSPTPGAVASSTSKRGESCDI